ncbi:hypothetical protein PEBR_40768 [Penicillium brasilianum]|uniref:Uncharacterized protein n=1 Tax=Penicillium brasilianum TaxID=104259 RepID=A0A1S9R909_PENBI|nr:hypothetical protein PEBR_40768 [Penicillium brasilianum]
MSAAAYDSISTDGKSPLFLQNTVYVIVADSPPEVSEPALVDVSKPDNYTNRANESASSARQDIAEIFEPGDTKTTTRRLLDTPTGVRDQFTESGEESSEKGKSMLDSGREIVARALGGGSRGEWLARLSIQGILIIF